MTTAIERRVIVLEDKQNKIMLRAETIAEMLRGHLVSIVTLAHKLDAEKVNKWVHTIQRLAKEYQTLEHEIAKHESGF